MKLLIDAHGGMAGDMFSAALVSAGADFKSLQEVMLAAGQELGSARIDIANTPDGAFQLVIKLESARRHLAGKEAREILAKLFGRFGVKEKYRALGMNILEILTKAEIKAHKEFNIVIENDHLHHSHHAHNHHDDHHYHTHSNHSHDDHEHAPHDHEYHDHEEEAFLHEAQDIVIDIMGAVVGMQLLGIEPEAELTAPVSVGGGHVHFSHGTLPVPAPATSIILEQYGIQWEKGPIEKELFTPTGAAILAALGTKVNAAAIDSLDVKAIGTSRGTKLLDIPPLKLMLY
jgi:uncharacterized protein (DUF111 family)